MTARARAVARGSPVLGCRRLPAAGDRAFSRRVEPRRAADYLVPSPWVAPTSDLPGVEDSKPPTACPVALRYMEAVPARHAGALSRFPGLRERAWAEASFASPTLFHLLR